MKPFFKTIRLLGALALASLGSSLPATAGEPEVELRCELRPTRAAAARASTARFRAANARFLRAEIASELATVQSVSPDAHASRPTFGRPSAPPR